MSCAIDLVCDGSNAPSETARSKRMSTSSTTSQNYFCLSLLVAIATQPRELLFLFNALCLQLMMTSIFFPRGSFHALKRRHLRWRGLCSPANKHMQVKMIYTYRNCMAMLILQTRYT